MDAQGLISLLDIIATLFLGLVGLYFTTNFRRQVKQKTADERVKAYSKLWQIMEVARPTREDERHHEGVLGYLTQKEREDLFDQFTHWYFQDGNGMFLGDSTRRIYLHAKHNLACSDDEIRPKRLYDQQLKHLADNERLQKRGEWSIRELSLLRARMRADLEVYGTVYFGGLQAEDVAFLEYCGEDLRRRPWSRQRTIERTRLEA
jgi:hypothetical protein